MQTVTFLKSYDHPINETQVEAYLEGQTLDVRDEVATAAGDRCKPATKAEIKAATTEAEAPPVP